MPVGRAKGRRQIGRFEPYYEVAESYLGPLWAVKVLSGPGRGSPAFLREVPSPSTDASDRLVAAARSAQSIEGEGVLAPVEADHAEGGVYVVTNYVEGENLRTLHGLSSVRRRPIELGVALRIGLDLLEALQFAHDALASEGCAFGGVAPDNVLIGSDGRARLMDAGLASVAATVKTLAGRSERIAYLAPEQVGKYAPGTADARTDVFAVGVLLWEMLSNRRLFIGSDQAVAQKVLQGKIPPLDKVKRRGDFALPPALVALVSRALEREPDVRFPDLASMRDAMNACGGDAASNEDVAALVKAVAESNIDRRVDAMRDATGKTTAPALRVPSGHRPAEEDASTQSAPLGDPMAKRTRVLGVDLSSPPPGSPNVATGLPRPSGPPRRPAGSWPDLTDSRHAGEVPPPVGDAAPGTSGETAGAPATASPPETHARQGRVGARARMRTMVGLAPPMASVQRSETRADPTPSTVPEVEPAAEAAPTRSLALRGAPMVQLGGRPGGEGPPPLPKRRPAAPPPPESTAGPLFHPPEPPREPSPSERDVFPDSAIEPVGISRLAPGERSPGAAPHSPVAPPVQDVIDTGAAWPPAPPAPEPAAEPSERGLGTPAGDGILDRPLPAPPLAPNVTRSPETATATGPVPRADPLGTPTRPKTSLPPSALFPSKVPPPLIHDPRAKRAPTARSGPTFLNGLLVGAIVAVVVVALGVGIGLFVIRDRQTAIDLEAMRAAARKSQAEQAAGAPELVAAPAPSEEPTAAPPASASAPPAASAEEALVRDGGKDGAPGAPSTSASVPPPPPAAPRPVYRRPIRRAPKPKPKFVPDDI